MLFVPVPNSVGAMFRLMFVAMAGVSATIAAARRLNAIDEEIQKYRDDIMRQHQSAITAQRVREFTSSPKRAEAIRLISQRESRSRPDIFTQGRPVDIQPPSLLSHLNTVAVLAMCSPSSGSTKTSGFHEPWHIEGSEQPHQDVMDWIETVEPEFRAELEADLELLIRDGYTPSIAMLQATLDRLRLAKGPDYKYSSRRDR